MVLPEIRSRELSFLVKYNWLGTLWKIPGGDNLLVIYVRINLLSILLQVQSASADAIGGTVVNGKQEMYKGK